MILADNKEETDFQGFWYQKSCLNFQWQYVDTHTQILAKFSVAVSGRTHTHWTQTQKGKQRLIFLDLFKTC